MAEESKAGDGDRLPREYERFEHTTALAKDKSMFRVMGAEAGDIERMIENTGCNIRRVEGVSGGDPGHPKYTITRTHGGKDHTLTHTHARARTHTHVIRA